ncbi:uncharacterized protein LOC125646579 isoform X2 [Ostrea edulis]|uniref:uncharacterized protein LOC125646579 isoform X2 n=1 Tax=Ostrea edulis TaxID=37623 RepID=UPI00209523DC|nr:uncharacterized protein LOC125646579 isoform X2 [Ostrea edulis]
METKEDNTPEVPGEQGQNTYVELVTENDVVIQGITCKSTALTKSQKKRRRFIPIRYHGSIFKISRKKKEDQHAPASSCTEQRAHGKTETQVEKCRESTNSSSYISCKTHRTVSNRSDLSSHLYDDIDECTQSRERCNSISTSSTFSSIPSQKVNSAVHDTRAVRGILREQIHESSSNRNQIHYQMEVLKKTGQRTKKYMGLFCMILVCAVISTIIAILVSKNVLGSNSPNVKNGNQSTSIPNYPDKQYMQEIFFNATHEGGKSNTGIIRQDFKVMKEELRERLSKMIHGIRCISSCDDQPDGDYQSCYTCHGFVSCSNGKLKNMNCPPFHEFAPIYWDDYLKICNYTSDTCEPEYIFKRATNGIN